MILNRLRRPITVETNFVTQETEIQKLEEKVGKIYIDMLQMVTMRMKARGRKQRSLKHHRYHQHCSQAAVKLKVLLCMYSMAENSIFEF